jgi:hypothetical protein
MALFGLIKPKRPIPEHEWEWLLAGLRWLEEEFPRDGEAVGAARLILPTEENYPQIPSNLEKRATALFGQTKRLAELEGWPTELVGYRNEDPLALINPALVGQHQWSDAAGTFQMIPDGSGGWFARISYDVELLRDPEGYIATMAHELAHYLLSAAKRCPPGGWDLHELATDLAAVWMGFGVFLANNAKMFEGYSDHDRSGWRAGTRGYLNERAILTATALCSSLRGDDVMMAAPHLKPYLKKGLKEVWRFVEGINVSAAMAEIDLDDFGVQEISDEAA